MSERAHIFVSGRVQGVFFRYSTLRKARQFGLTGWVRNLSDGRVEAVFEGEKSALQEMLAWVKEGPAFAKVQDLEISLEEAGGQFSDFEIRE